MASNVDIPAGNDEHKSPADWSQDPEYLLSTLGEVLTDLALCGVTRLPGWELDWWKAGVRLLAVGCS